MKEEVNEREKRQVNSAMEKWALGPGCLLGEDYKPGQAACQRPR